MAAVRVCGCRSQTPRCRRRVRRERRFRPQRRTTTFIASDRLALHEDVKSGFERTFLVAHEIGHVVLGDDLGGELSRDIDPERLPG